MSVINDMLRHVLLSTPAKIPNNEGVLTDHLVRHSGSTVDQVDCASTEACREFLLQLIEDGVFNPVEKEDLPPTVFFDSGLLIKATSAPCMYFGGDLPEGYTAVQKFKYWKDLTESEKDRAVIRAGHDDQNYQVFLPGMEGIACDTVKVILGPKDFGQVGSPLIFWSWWPGDWAVRCSQEIKDPNFSKDQIDPYMVVKGE